MAEISVVMPAFNAARTIERAVRSILNQSFQNFELLVMDDGSTDGTLDVVRAISDSRLQLFELPHAGVVSAANAGTSVATAPLMARMDADDFARPERLQKQIDYLCHFKFDVVGCQVGIVDEDGVMVESMANYQQWINEESLDPDAIRALRFVEFPLVNPTILARREYFELGFRDGDFPEDYDLFLRAMARGMTAGKVPAILHDWIDGPKRLTRSDSRYSSMAFERCRREHVQGGPLASRKSVDLWGIGNAGKPWLRWLRDSGYTIRHGYDINPRLVGETIHGVTIQNTADLRKADETPLLIAVGAPGARKVIAPQLQANGYQIGGDAWFVA